MIGEEIVVDVGVHDGRIGQGLEARRSRGRHERERGKAAPRVEAPAEGDEQIACRTVVGDHLEARHNGAVRQVQAGHQPARTRRVDLGAARPRTRFTDLTRPGVEVAVDLHVADKPAGQDSALGLDADAVGVAVESVIVGRPVARQYPSRSSCAPSYFPAPAAAHP